MKTRRLGIRFFLVCLLTVVLLSGLVGACSKETPAPTTTAPAPATTAPAPATTAPAPATTAPAPKTTAPAPATTAPAGPKQGGILRQIVTETPTGSIGVPENMRGAGGMLKLYVLEPLLYQHLDGTIETWLAESYEWSNDYLTCTMHLVKNATFHDGTPFNAAAVKWNWDKRAAKGVAGTTITESLEIIDDYTIAFRLTKFNSSWIDNITCTGISTTTLMISPTAYEANGEDWANWHPVGTGPYVFKEYIDSQSLTIERNEDYWGERPNFDGIKWTFIADYVTAMIAFEAGEGDTVSSTGHARDLALELLTQKEKGYWAVQGSGLFYTLMTSGGKSASPFSNLKVREATEYAIDKEKIVHGVYFDWAIPMAQTAMTFQLPYDPNAKGRDYDPDKARQLLTEAGYPNGFKTTLYCQVGVYGKDVDAVQAYLANVGIDCTLEILSVGKWIELETYGWEDGIEVFPLGTETYRGQVDINWERPIQPSWPKGKTWETMYRPDELEALVQRYYTITDVAEEKAVGKQIVQLIYDQAICIPLWQQIQITVLQPWVKCSDATQVYLTGGIWGVPMENFWMEK